MNIRARTGAGFVQTQERRDTIARHSIALVADGSAEDASELTAREVRSIIKVRRARTRFFESELFSDPAWDMLLDLAAARLEGRKVPVSSLCIAGGVPATTALRWIRMMTDQGLLERAADPEDGRRIFIELTDCAFERMRRYLHEASRTCALVA